MDSLGEIRDTAAKWFARRGGEDWNAQDEAQLAQWLNASTGNRIEFMRLQATWQEANRLKVLGAGLQPGVIPDLEDFRASPYFRRVRAESTLEAAPSGSERPVVLRKHWRFAAAASILLAVALGFWVWGALRGTVYVTPIGVTAAVPLPDGSKITLNTNSEIRVAVTATERRVNLEQGEAFFEVVQDPTRPFTVDAGDKRIEVLGTKFSVRREGDEVSIVVTEGKVRLKQARGIPEIPAAELSAGSVARAREAKVDVEEKSLSEAEELLSWRSGYVVFHETALVDAAAEFNRYNTRKIIVKDAAIADIGISGNFRATNIDSFARLLESGFPVNVQRQDGRIVLTHKP